MGTEWYDSITPRPKDNTLGSYAVNIGNYYLDTQEKGASKPGTGVWNPDLIPTDLNTKWYDAVGKTKELINKQAKKQLEKQVKANGRGIQATQLINWISPSYGRVANVAAGHKLNDINLLSKSDRLLVGDYATGAWNLIPDYNESQTRGLDQHVRKSKEGPTGRYIKNDGSRYYTGETPTYKDIKPTSIWHIDPTWQRRD